MIPIPSLNQDFIFRQHASRVFARVSCLLVLCSIRTRANTPPIIFDFAAGATLVRLVRAGFCFTSPIGMCSPFSSTVLKLFCVAYSILNFSTAPTRPKFIISTYRQSCKLTLVRLNHNTGPAAIRDIFTACSLALVCLLVACRAVPSGSIYFLCEAGTRIRLVHHSPTQTLDCPQSKRAREARNTPAGKFQPRRKISASRSKRRQRPTRGNAIRARGARAPGARHGIKGNQTHAIIFQRRLPPSYTVSPH